MGGVPEAVFELIPAVIAACIHCRKFKLPGHRPKAGAELAGWFNDNVLIDLFFLWDLIRLMIVDEATRYKVIEKLPNRTAYAIFAALLRGWIRYFGPMKNLVSDQEGGVTAEETAIACERYSINRVLKGCDPEGRHTGTGLAEKHIHLSKLSALKCLDVTTRMGLTEITREDVMFEVGMGQNILLEYGGYSPSQCVIGCNPRG